MSLESILNTILSKANADKEVIIQTAQKEAREITRLAKKEAQRLYEEIVQSEKVSLEKERQRQLVNARLNSKKLLLQVKQEAIDMVFERVKVQINKARFKKLLVSKDKSEEVSEDINFYLENIRLENESEIAKLLFK